MTSVLSVMKSVPPACHFRSHRNLSVLPKNTTRCYRSHYRKNYLPLTYVILLIQLHSMNLVLYQHHIFLAALICDSRTKPIVTTNPKGPSWNLMSKGEIEITSKIYHIYRERSHQNFIISLGGENTQEERVIFKDPRCLVFKRRDATCLLEGKDMFICAYLHYHYI